MQKDARLRLRQEFRRLGFSERQLSLAIGRGATYLSEFIVKGVPQKLDYDDAVELHKLTTIPLPWFGYELPPGMPPSPQAAALGFTADAEILASSMESRLAPQDHEIRCKVLSKGLNQHPEYPLRPGDLVIIDKTPEGLRPEDGSILLVYLHDREENSATPILRQFVAPNLLITNTTCRSLASILNMDERGLPFDVLIAGRLTFHGRGNGRA